MESEGQTARAKYVVGDPSYFPDKVLQTSSVVRAICILSHPIPNTDNSHSVQIILPQRQVMLVSLNPADFIEALLVSLTLLCSHSCLAGVDKLHNDSLFEKTCHYITRQDFLHSDKAPASCMVPALGK